MDEPICYLDGRYFNLALAGYKELHSFPLIIRVTEQKEQYKVDVSIKKLPNPQPGEVKLVKCVFEYHNYQKVEIRHSNLLMFYHDTIYRFDPSGYDKLPQLSLLIQKLFDKSVIEIDPGSYIPENNPRCERSGFCNAYIIKYALSWLNNVKYDPSGIIIFSKGIIKNYNKLLRGSPEIEYDISNSTAGLIIGGLAGAGIGGLVGGVPGALIGGAGGAALGYFIPKAF